MGVSTNGQICFGVGFDDGFEFPWEEYDDGIHDWWREVQGFAPPVQIYDKYGEYLNGVEPSKEDESAYYDAKHKWEEENPLPVELVNARSMSYPLWILAVAGTVVTARRGYPEEIFPATMLVTDSRKEFLLDFCKKYGIDTNGAEPAWYLSSFWET